MCVRSFRKSGRISLKTARFSPKNRARFRRATHRTIIKITVIDKYTLPGPSADCEHGLKPLGMRGPPILRRTSCKIAPFSRTNLGENLHKSTRNARQTRGASRKMMHRGSSRPLKQRRCLCADFASHVRVFNSKIRKNFIEIRAVFAEKSRAFSARNAPPDHQNHRDRQRHSAWTCR